MTDFHNFKGKRDEFKRRIRLAIEQARDANARGDKFDAAFLLNYSARCRMKIAEINARVEAMR